MIGGLPRSHGVVTQGDLQGVSALAEGLQLEDLHRSDLADVEISPLRHRRVRSGNFKPPLVMVPGVGKDVDDPVQLTEDLVCIVPPIQREVSEMIDYISGLNYDVPTPDQLCIHFIGSEERTVAKG